MSEIEKLKKLRSVAKRKVNILIRKLTTSIHYDDQNASVLRTSLEEEFDTLTDLDQQLIEMEENDDYLVDLNVSYNHVIELYYNSLKENVMIKKQKEAIPLRSSTERNITRVTDNVERLRRKLTLDPSKLTKIDLIEIEEDKLSLPSAIDIMLNDMSALSLLIDISELDCRVNSIVNNADIVTRDINVLIRLYHSYNEISSDLGSLPENSVTKLLSKAEIRESPTIGELPDQIFPEGKPKSLLKGLNPATEDQLPKFPDNSSPLLYSQSEQHPQSFSLDSKQEQVYMQGNVSYRTYPLQPLDSMDGGIYTRQTNLQPPQSLCLDSKQEYVETPGNAYYRTYPLQPTSGGIYTRPNNIHPPQSLSSHSKQDQIHIPGNVSFK